MSACCWSTCHTAHSGRRRKVSRRAHGAHVRSITTYANFKHSLQSQARRRWPQLILPKRARFHAMLHRASIAALGLAQPDACADLCLDKGERCRGIWPGRVAPQRGSLTPSTAGPTAWRTAVERGLEEDDLGAGKASISMFWVWTKVVGGSAKRPSSANTGETQCHRGPNNA